MDNLYIQSLKNMEKTLRDFEKSVSAPKFVKFGKGQVFRYVEQTIHQAIIQKLARIISGLYAARILLEHGFVQELGALQRMLDEFYEDIIFLSYAIICDDVTELHQKYLDAFYEEEFDNPEDPISSTQKRPMIQRKKIRAYLSRIKWQNLNPSTNIQLSRSINEAYSGFIHGASPHIMEMYGGDPPRFHVSGMLNTPRVAEHADDIWNYFFRGIIAFGFAAKAFGDDQLFNSIREYRDSFIKESGKE